MSNSSEDSWRYEKLIIRAIVSVIISFILTVGSCCIHVDYRIAKAIEDDVDPVAARMALSNDSYTTERAIYMLINKGD